MVLLGFGSRSLALSPEIAAGHGLTTTSGGSPVTYPSCSSVSSLLKSRSTRFRSTLRAAAVESKRLGNSYLSHLEAFSSSFPASLDQLATVKLIPAEICKAIFLFQEFLRRIPHPATVLQSLYLSMWLKISTLNSGSLVLIPVNDFEISGVNPVIISTKLQCSLTVTTTNPQESPSLTPTTIKSDLLSLMIDDGAFPLTILGQQWYHMGPMGLILIYGFGLGLNVLKELVIFLDSLIRIIELLVGILCYYFGGLVLGLDYRLGLVFRSGLDLANHRFIPRLSFIVNVSHFYKTISLSDVFSRSRENIIFWLVMQSVVNPERCSSVRRFTASLERPILFQTVQRRATDLDSLRLPFVFDSLECLEHLSHRECCWNIGHDIPLISLLSEALSFIFRTYLLLAAVSLYLDFFIVTETICST